MRFWKIHFASLLRKSIAILTALAVFLMWKSMTDINRVPRVFSPSPIVFPVRNCRGINAKGSSVISDKIVFYNTSASVHKRVLLLTKRAQNTNYFVAILEGNRIAYDIHYLAEGGKNLLPSLTERDNGKYIAVIFTSFSHYFELDLWSKRLLDNYCRTFGVGMILFNEGETTSRFSITETFPFKVYTNDLEYKSYIISKNATILRITKGNNVLDSDGENQLRKWSVFIPPAEQKVNRNFEIVAASNFVESKAESAFGMSSSSGKRYPVVVHDLGKHDHIHRMYFGTGVTFWPHKLLFLDALGFVSQHKLERSLDRWIQVDVDDIFVGRTGIRMKKDDVKAMIGGQHLLKKLVPGFQFNLGFSGKYFEHGNAEEDEGDRELIENAKEFRWFDHTWGHKQPHQVDNLEDLKQQIFLNMEFAKKHNIPFDTSYSVSPHHSGVYPVHDILYKAWTSTTGVQVTSTEEYPNLKPAWKRRGFIYRDVMVLPRQTCGLFTHTLFLDKYPGGKDVLLESIYGGDLFQLFVTNPINIFMTHLSNYGNDRLALYTFTNVIKFVQCWTNLNLMSLPPLELGKKYFALFPGDKEPLWNNPCKSPRHKDIWPSWKSCNRLPSFLVVGPQKTGTTALHMFLSVHPEVQQNNQNKKSYEETQFFASINYKQGLEWYMNNFPDIPMNSSILLFEKTANYFDSMKAPMRVHALLPDAKIIVILNDPVKRAYSWYQHVRSHDDKTALNTEFYDLLTSKVNASAAVRTLRARCLKPGLYAYHMERWLLHFPSTQILTIDGEQLRSDPVEVMSQVQVFIGVKKKIDYGTRLRYNERKGFFCLTARTYNGHSCLGISKGRKYPPMKNKAEEYLKNYFREPNRQLAELLHKIRRPLPQWLRSDVV